jgi:hypothetical protein
VSCPFHYAGCDVKLPRKDIPEHAKDITMHLELLASVAQSLQEEARELERQNDRQHRELEAARSEIKSLKEDMFKLKLSLGEFPFEFRVNYSNKRAVFLPAFCTHSHGYKMCIEAYPNGLDGKGNHVSIYAHLMQGPFDDQLIWPFRGGITVQIVNQAGNHDHVETTILYTVTTPLSSAGRVTNKELAVGWGFNQFLARENLAYNAEKKTQYLKDNVIIVRVVGVKLA